MGIAYSMSTSAKLFVCFLCPPIALTQGKLSMLMMRKRMVIMRMMMIMIDVQVVRTTLIMWVLSTV